MQYQCNLIVDACCDLPSDLVTREGVQLIGFPYFFGDEERVDDLWQTADPKEFYARMRKGEQPKTAQASLMTLSGAFAEAAEKGVPTVYLCFSSALSSSYDQACLVADQVRADYPGFELHVVDTRLASTGEALIVYEALRQQERGMTAAELAEWALEARNYVNVYFMVEDLDCLHRGGRIPASVAVVGSKLDVKPVLMIPEDGSLAVKAVARGRKKGLRQLASLYLDNAAEQDNQPVICIANADCEKDMKRLEELIRKECGKDRQAPVFIESTIGPVIGTHVGPGMVALVFWGPDKRDKLSVADRIARKVRNRE